MLEYSHMKNSIRWLYVKMIVKINYTRIIESQSRESDKVKGKIILWS